MIITSRQYFRALYAIGALACLISGTELYQRAAIELNGTIVSSESSCIEPQHNRCATEYVVEGADHSRIVYIAGPTDKALPRQLPIGTEIFKSKWALGYSVNGQFTNNFPVGLYAGLFALGLCCVGWGFILYRQSRAQ